MNRSGLPGGTLPLVADGAISSYLERRGGGSVAPESLNLDDPGAVESAHREYAAAGATLIRTNTRSANPVALERFGLADRCEAIVNTGSALARGVASASGVVMGTIGPVPPGPDGRPLSIPDQEQALSQPLIYLSDTGADFFLLEHFARLAEAQAAVRVARRVSDAPVLALLMFDGQGRDADGMAAAACAEALLEEGAQALGVCCTPGGEALRAVVAELLSFGVPLSVLVGREALEGKSGGGGAEDFAETLTALAERGVAIVGGCCGIDPAHIQALAKALGRAT